ncbi:MAG TPA: PaaI family thioesterase [Acidimicrobiales bacterium]|nr:PaaI family thioesterase [Acidimicrobiales bacterium]
MNDSSQNSSEAPSDLPSPAGSAVPPQLQGMAPEPSTFMRAAGLQMTSIAKDRVEGYIDVTAAHHQPFGIVHGGVYTSAVETSASMGAFVAAQEQELTAVGVSNSTNFLRSMSAGRLAVVAVPLQQGRTTQLWEVRITDERDRLVAIGQVRLQNVPLR